MFYKKQYEELQRKYDALMSKYEAMKADRDKLKSDKGYDIIDKIALMAEKAGIDKFSDNYQDIMTRVFMQIGGRESSVLKTYSGMTFIKDYSDEDIKRAVEYAQKNKVIGMAGKKKWTKNKCEN